MKLYGGRTAPVLLGFSPKRRKIVAYVIVLIYLSGCVTIGVNSIHQKISHKDRTLFFLLSCATSDKLALFFPVFRSHIVVRSVPYP